MKRAILIGDDPRLRQKAAEVAVSELTTPEMQATIDDLFETMEIADGLGLAAPQVGISKRMAIVVLEDNSAGIKGPICLVNPVITNTSKERELGEEGCLSFPGLFGKVARFKTISVKALDRSGAALAFECSDMDARVIQHELDHLNGVLLPDRLKEKERAPESKSKGRSL